MEEKRKIEDLAPIANLGADLVLFVLREDLTIQNPYAVQIDFDTFEIGKILELDRYMTYGVYYPIDNNNIDLVFGYYDKINRKFSDEDINEMLQVIDNASKGMNITTEDKESIT